MKFLKRNIPVKYLYMLSAMVALLVTLGLYTTYAMFTANVSSGNVVNMDTTLYYDFDISGTQSFHLTKNSIASFYATINNTSQGAIYYEVYYTSNNDLSNVIVAEVVEDKTTTPNAINTSGNIDTNTSKDIPIVIANNSDSDIDIVIGVVSGYVGNAIVYGSDGYPNGTKITATYNKNDITNSCEAGTNVNEDCIEEVENGYLVTYCPVTSVIAPFYKDSSNANAPVLADGMIPVMHNGTTWVKADYYDKTSQYAGYDYANKKWANAVMVSSATRDTYMTADIGTPVEEADILAYYVWIPRYKYQLFNVEFAEIDEQLINVQFESGTASTGTVTCSTSEIGVETCTNKANGNWYTHPAFTFGEDELEGIWVGKFETGYGTNTTGYPSNTVYSTPTIKPNVSSFVRQQVSIMFETTLYFGTTAYLTSAGVNEVDAHIMKNMEWGAVAYLKQSIYGLGIIDMDFNSYGNLNQTSLNYNDPNFRTGCGPQSAGSTSFGNTCNAYNTTLGMSASTTGNITGVYDMSGGAFDVLMGVIQDNTTSGRSPMSGSSTSNNSGYIGKVGSSYANSGNTLAFPAAKYYDLYANGTTYLDQTAYNRSHLGDATGETRSWYSDYAAFPDAYCPWFKRGSNASNGQASGLFSFLRAGGDPYILDGSRAALIVTK